MEYNPTSQTLQMMIDARIILKEIVFSILVTYDCMIPTMIHNAHYSDLTKHVWGLQQNLNIRLGLSLYILPNEKCVVKYYYTFYQMKSVTSNPHKKIKLFGTVSSFPIISGTMLTTK